jgi:hypothetical protein
MNRGMKDARIYIESTMKDAVQDIIIMMNTSKKIKKENTTIAIIFLCSLYLA